MTRTQAIFSLFALSLLSCTVTDEQATSTTYPDVQVVGAMKNVMWQGKLDGSIALDTISDKNGLYGLGPLSFLKGELLIHDGKSYVSKVTSDSTMSVEQTFAVSAPFFVYAHVTDWLEMELPTTVKTIPDLEQFLDEQTKTFKRPSAFKLIGTVEKADIHIQNLPDGITVSSPAEAHQGQINYPLENEKVVVVGFFSTTHQGIFTHHDSFLHLHLITQDERKMGHLDAVNMKKMRLFLPNG